MLARAAVGTRSGFARCGRRCRPARADGKPRRFRTAPAISASTSFSDDIRGYDRTATSSGSGTATSGVASRAGLRAPTGVTVSIPHLTALLLDLNAEGRRIIRGVVDKGDLGLLNKNDRDAERRDAGAYEYDPGVDAQTEADRRVEAHVLRALGAFCPELRVVAEESYENPEAAIPESDDFADLPGDVAATIAPFPAAPNGGPPAPRRRARRSRASRRRAARSRRRARPVTFLVTRATRNESPKRLRLRSVPLKTQSLWTGLRTYWSRWTRRG